MPKKIIDLSDLTPDPLNANKGKPYGMAVLEDSIDQFGFGRPILADCEGRIIAGNKTLETAATKGFPVRVIETSGNEIIVHQRTDLNLARDARAKGLAIADNRTSELNLDWDGANLTELLCSIDNDLGSLQGTGFTSGDLENLLNDLAGTNSGLLDGADADDVPENAPTRCQAGELWQLGEHRIACIDSRDEEAVKALLGDDVPAMVWSDPPYGIDAVSKDGYSATSRTPYPFGGVNGKGKPVAKTVYAPVIGDDSTKTAEEASALCLELFPSAIQFWWGGNNYANALPPSSCWIVWDKETNGNLADAELAWCSDKGSVRLFRHMWNGMVKASEHGERRIHPTQKPVALAEWCFEKYGKSGDIIFDPFLGSGMSVIAAEKTGRRVIGAELSPEYIDKIIARFEHLTGKTATRIEPKCPALQN